MEVGKPNNKRRRNGADSIFSAASRGMSKYFVIDVLLLLPRLGFELVQKQTHNRASKVSACGAFPGLVREKEPQT